MQKKILIVEDESSLRNALRDKMKDHDFEVFTAIDGKSGLKQAIKNRFGKYINVEKWWHKAMELGQDEKAWLDKRKIMTFEQLLERQPWNDRQVSKAA